MTDATTGRWRYAAEKGDGMVVKGEVNAIDRDEALRMLSARALRPISLIPTARRVLQVDRGFFDHHSLGMAALSRISGRLRDLLLAGIPLAASLKLAMEQAERPREREFLSGLDEKVRAGKPLSAAITASPIATPRFFCALVEAGEALGALGRQFEILAAHYDDALKLRRELHAQLLYPVALFVLIVATLFFLSFVVLPQFETIFTTSDATPPTETRFVMSAGRFIRDYWMVAPPVILTAIFVATYLAKRNPRRLEIAKLSAPMFGRLLLYAEYGRYLRTMSALLLGGAPLARAMPLASESVSLSILRDEAHQAEDSVRTGARLSAALAATSRCPRDLLDFLEIGEETGELGRLSAQGAARAEHRVRTSLARFMALLAPALTALMGLLTAGVIAAVMTGVLSLNDAVS